MKDSKSNKRELIGKVVSAKITDSIVVAVGRTYRHPIYKKAIRRTHRFLVHNTLSDIAVGDFVRIVESKPISQRKHFIVVEKVKA